MPSDHRTTAEFLELTIFLQHWTHALAPANQRRFITWMQGWVSFVKKQALLSANGIPANQHVTPFRSPGSPGSRLLPALPTHPRTCCRA